MVEIKQTIDNYLLISTNNNEEFLKSNEKYTKKIANFLQKESKKNSNITNTATVENEIKFFRFNIEDVLILEGKILARVTPYTNEENQIVDVMVDYDELLVKNIDSIQNNFSELNYFLYLIKKEYKEKNVNFKYSDVDTTIIEDFEYFIKQYLNDILLQFLATDYNLLKITKNGFAVELTFENDIIVNENTLYSKIDLNNSFLNKDLSLGELVERKNFSDEVLEYFKKVKSSFNI